MAPKLFDKAFAAQFRQELPDAFSALVLTWNVGNAPPPEDFSLLFGARPELTADMILIGLQECKYSADSAAPDAQKKKAKGPVLSHFVVTASAFLGDEYTRFISQEFGEMKLIGFVKKEFERHIYDVTSSAEATGIFRVIANKGGIAACFTIGDAKFAVVSSHLNAHAGEERKLLRHKDTREIFKGTKALTETKTELTTACHHVFWMGDLNYRMHLPNVMEAVPEAHEEKWKIVKGWVDTEQWEKLYQADELQHDIALGEVFAGFKEGPMSFQPTFKVERTPELKYIPQRVPAYCDRILWKSFPNVADHITQMSLKPLLNVPTSDHKPVVGTFNIKIKKNEFPPPDKKEKLFLKFLDLKGENLVDKDVGGLSDPYVWMYSAEGILKYNNKYKKCSTSVKNDTINPTWEEKDIPVMGLVCSLEEAQSASLTFLLYDKDRASLDDFLGAAVIALSDVDGLDTPTAFTAPIHRKGKSAGKLAGTFVITTARK